MEGIMVFLSIEDRRIRSRIHTSDLWIRIREAQKHVNPVDPDLEHCSIVFEKLQSIVKKVYLIIQERTDSA